MSLGQANSFDALLDQTRGWAYELGFDSLEFRPIERSDHEPHLRQWLAKGYHGEMGYMARNVDLRVEPKALHPGCLLYTSPSPRDRQKSRMPSSA